MDGRTGAGPCKVIDTARQFETIFGAIVSGNWHFQINWRHDFSHYLAVDIFDLMLGPRKIIWKKAVNPKRYGISLRAIDLTPFHAFVFRRDRQRCFRRKGGRKEGEEAAWICYVLGGRDFWPFHQLAINGRGVRIERKQALLDTGELQNVISAVRCYSHWHFTQPLLQYIPYNEIYQERRKKKQKYCNASLIYKSNRFIDFWSQKFKGLHCTGFGSSFFYYLTYSRPLK